MVADRTRPEVERRALELTLRVALRGRRISSTHLPAVNDSIQHFVKAREHLTAGLDAASGFADHIDPDPDDE